MPDYPYPDVQLLIFAKAPVAGYCKTRLIPVVGKQGAADLQQELIKQCIQQLCSKPLCPTQLWCSPDIQHPCFKTLAEKYPISLQVQQGKDLGDRMYHAMSSQESPYTIIVGTDCPVLTRDYVEQAISVLHEGSQAVIGPAEDGGYVLLGLRHVAATLFQCIAWGSAKVFQQTSQKLDAAGFVWQSIETLWDVDDEQDLLRYRDIKMAHSK